MSLYYLSLGSNLHSSHAVPACIKLLKENFSIKKISSIYETEPIGPAGGNAFWNLVVQIETGLNQKSLDQSLKKIEEMLGRKRDPHNKYAPRLIDIDILPQKDYDKLPFIIIPLAEISPEEKDPHTKKTFAELEKKFLEEKKNYKIV